MAELILIMFGAIAAPTMTLGIVMLNLGNTKLGWFCIVIGIIRMLLKWGSSK